VFFAKNKLKELHSVALRQKNKEEPSMLGSLNIVISSGSNSKDVCFLRLLRRAEYVNVNYA